MTPSVSFRCFTCVQSWLRLCGSRPSVGSSRNRIFGVCSKPRAISSRRFMPPENVLTSSVAPVPQLEQRQQPLDALGADAARDVVEHAVQVHVLVGGQLAVEARILEDDAEAAAHVVRLRRRDRGRRSRSCPLVGASSVVSILIVVVLPAPLGPRKAKISPACTSNEMPSTAAKSPERLLRGCRLES